MQIKKVKSRLGGYTIIETMIAISLFLIIVVFGTAALVNANIIYQKSHSMRSIMDNLNFIMEDIARNIKTGYNFRCVTQVSDLNAISISTPKSGAACWGVAFESATGTTSASDQWVYYAGTDGSSSDTGLFKSTDGGTTFVRLTPNEVSIDTANTNFSVLGAEAPAANTQQPLTTIRIVGSITNKGVVSPFNLQTSASQRLVDI